MKENCWREHENCPALMPDRKTFLFFNCLLDGMHTSRKASKGFNLPISLSEILNTMPTDKSIAAIYKKMSEKQKLEKSLSIWGDAIVWSDFHKAGSFYDQWD